MTGCNRATGCNCVTSSCDGDNYQAIKLVGSANATDANQLSYISSRKHSKNLLLSHYNGCEPGVIFQKSKTTNVAIKEISKDLLLSHYNGFKPVVIFQESKTLQNLTLISCSFYILIFSSHQNTNKFDETRSSKLVS